MSNSRRPAVGVDGLNTLKRTMREAGVSVQDLKDTHAAVAQTVVRAVRFTPRTTRSTGAMIASVRGSGQAGAAVVRAGRASLARTNPVHWGWPSRHIVGQPFLWDAIADAEETWVGQYLAGLQDIINRVEGAPGP